MSHGGRSFLRGPVLFLASHRLLVIAGLTALAAAVAAALLVGSGLVSSEGTSDIQATNLFSNGASQPPSNQSVPTPPGTLFPVTALPGQLECNRPDSEAQQAQMDLSEIEAIATEGVVKIESDLASGLGFASATEGIVVTDSRVVEGSWLIKVTLADGQILDGDLLGINETLGIAYVEVPNGDELTPIPWGDPAAVCEGDIAYAFSRHNDPSAQSPLPSLSSGHISAVRGTLLETDLSLGPGSMGGPLLSNSARVVGVNTAGLSVSGNEATSTRNFAIPIIDVMRQLESGLERDELTLGARPVLRPTPTPAIPAIPPSPTPVPPPTPTLVPAPAPTPNLHPAMTATPAPRLLATAAPAPTPTRQPAATRMPTPTRFVPPTAVPTRRRLPTPTPAPPPTPTPAAVALVEYRNAEFGYAIDHPAGWRVERAMNGDVLLVSGRDGSHIEILSEPVSSDGSLGEFADSYRQRISLRARTWAQYTEVSAVGAFKGATNYVRIEFRRQENAGSCVENGITDLYRSRYFPSVSRGYAVTMSICEGSLDLYVDLYDDILETFSEIAPR